MLATYVTDQLTPASFTEAASAMRLCLRDRLGAEPSQEALALALGKCALETGHWQSMHRWNLGNVKAGETYEGSYCCFPLNEVLNGKVVWFSPRGRLDRKGGVVVAEHFEDPPGHPQTRMRAYQDLSEGTAAYVSFVAGGRYAGAWQRLLAGDAVGYVTELRAKGYFTAPLADYLKGVVGLQKQFISKLAALEPPPRARPTLKLGATGPDVEELQRALNRFGATLKVDGGFGQKTAAALAKFQRANSLIGDGVCGPATWAKLGVA